MQYSRTQSCLRNVSISKQKRDSRRFSERFQRFKLRVLRYVKCSEISNLGLLSLPEMHPLSQRAPSPHAHTAMGVFPKSRIRKTRPASGLAIRRLSDVLVVVVPGVATLKQKYIRKPELQNEAYVDALTHFEFKTDL